MARKKVIWTTAAKNERRDILQFWARNNKSKVFSEKLFREFQKSTRTVSEQPFIGKTTEMESVRYVIVRQFAITYHIGENTIHILSVWDERRDPATRPIQTEL